MEPFLWTRGAKILLKLALLTKFGVVRFYLTATCPRSHSWQMAESGFRQRPSAAEAVTQTCHHSPRRPTHFHNYETCRRNAHTQAHTPSPLHKAAFVLTQLCTPPQARVHMHVLTLQTPTHRVMFLVPGKEAESRKACSRL